MTLLITFILVALVFSFLCSIAEAVILSVTTAHISVLIKEQKKSGRILKKLKSDVNKPLAAILTLNTIAHTVGAVGAGAQATVVFGSNAVGIFSAIMTLLILVLSEIIPKTLGANYWRQLAPVTATGLNFIIWVLYPFVWMSEKITSGIARKKALSGFSRKEFSAMAELSAKEGTIADEESLILKNLLRIKVTPVKSAMTPRTVLFTLSDDLLVEEFFHKHDQTPFTRIPIYAEDKDEIYGFVIRHDLLLAQARGNGKKQLKNYVRDISALHLTSSLFHAFSEMVNRKAHIMLVVDEYGSVQGILTMEDIFETLMGLEIIDEKDDANDMQQLARKNWKHKKRQRGYDIEE